MHRLIRRTAAALLLTLLFALPALARPAARAEGGSGPGLFAVFWERAASLLGMLESRGNMDPNGVTAKSRGNMDPDGATTSAIPPDDGESRGNMDPNG